MKQKGTQVMISIALAIGVLCVQPALAKYKMANGTKDFYFGHISYVEIKNDGNDPVVYREGQTLPEVAILNLPLGPGDIIQTSDTRRCEIQFDNGTIVRLDFATELKIETILAQSLSSGKKISNLLLAKGQVYIMHKRYDSKEIFQVMTPHAAVKLDHNSVAVIKLTSEGETDVQVETGTARLLFGPDQSLISQVKINRRERYIVSADDQAEGAAFVESSDFISWNVSINKNFLALHEGSFLPEPLQKLPPAVFYFAQKFGNRYGEWIWHSLYGYVWRPYYNDYYPWGTWQPLFYGRWSVYRGQLFWIPEEPWGWVPYHLGIWMWDAKKGWLWLPGSLFAPAWAVWDFYSGYYLWRPWSLFDWYWVPSMHLAGYGSPPYSWLTSYAVPSETFSGQVVRSIRKSQLKKKETTTLPLPKDLKKSYQATIAALERGNENVLASLREIPRQAAMIKKGDLASPRMQEKVVGVEKFFRGPEAEPSSPKDSIRRNPHSVFSEALRALQSGRAASELRARVLSLPDHSESRKSKPSFEGFYRDPKTTARPETAGASFPGSDSVRFRDWNPDVRTAQTLGVKVSYSSRANAVTCPELGLSSNTMGPRVRLSGDSVGRGSWGGQGGSGESSGTSSSGGSTASAASSGPTHSGGSREGGHKEKN
ncbi:MAG: FecR family protein [Clostridiales bacterium]|nr:FecR family protein [Clostridiales bacterium]